MTSAVPRGAGPALLGVMLAAVLVPLNSTMIAVALPEVGDDLGVSSGTAGTLVVVYLIVMFVGQPLSGRLGDSVGARRLLIGGLGGMAVTSLAAGFVGSFGALVAARSVQAVFAATLMPNVQSIIRAETTPATRGRMFGLLGSLIGAGAALGPLVGGLVTAAAGWPAVFWVNLPVIAAALVLQRRPVESGVSAVEETTAEIAADAPPTGRVLNPVFGGSFLAQAATTFGQYTLILVVPLVLDHRGWSPGEIGLAVTALTVGMVVMGPVGGRVGDTRGRRLPTLVGLTIAWAALALLAVSGSGVAAALLIITLVAFGFGFGFAAPSLVTAAIESVPPARAGTASGLFATSRYSGSIPASVAFAVFTGTGNEGVDGLLLAAAIVALAAIPAALLLPRASRREADPE